MSPLPSGRFDTGAVLLVDKPVGPTSHDVVARVRRTLGERRIGHTGTLDPFASGLLVLCVGPATRLSEYLTGLDKAYAATVRLGQRTSTHDPEGEIVRESEGWREKGREDVEAALEGLRGTIRQVPPRFSAKKVGGEAAHRRARRGEEVALPAVEVTVGELEMDAFDPPLLDLRVTCSSGTYVRALARDLGEALGVGAHLVALRRTRVGRFRVEDALPEGALDDPGALLAGALDPARALAHLPTVAVGAGDAERLAHGQTVEAPPAADDDRPVVVVRDGALVAIATRAGATLRPHKVFARAGPA